MPPVPSRCCPGSVPRLRQGRGCTVSRLQDLNRLKNQYPAPESKDLAPRVTLATMLERGDDENRGTAALLRLRDTYTT